MNGMDDRHNGAAHAPVDEECGSDLDDEEVKIGRRRQVIGILVSICASFCAAAGLMASQVLQMGIMIHSLVIGLTLSIANGPEFSE